MERIQRQPLASDLLLQGLAGKPATTCNVSPSRDYEGADICRKVADKLEGIAASNRSKYGSAGEVKDAIWAKYSSQGAYKKYSHDQRAAMALAEINMTLYGTVRYSDARILGEIEGDLKNVLWAEVMMRTGSITSIYWENRWRMSLEIME